MLLLSAKTEERKITKSYSNYFRKGKKESERHIQRICFAIKKHWSRTINRQSAINTVLKTICLSFYEVIFISSFPYHPPSIGSSENICRYKNTTNVNIFKKRDISIIWNDLYISLFSNAEKILPEFWLSPRATIGMNNKKRVEHKTHSF